MSAAAELQRHYRDRTAAARAASARGRKVVGLVGSTVPTELVLASDAYPLTVAAAPGGPTPNADRYLERHIEDDTRATLEALLTGAYAWLDLLVLSRAWDSHLELYYTLKEIVRLGEGHSIPPALPLRPPPRAHPRQPRLRSRSDPRAALAARRAHRRHRHRPTAEGGHPRGERPARGAPASCGGAT